MSVEVGPSPTQASVKRGIDFVAAAVGLVASSPILLVAWAVATIDTRTNGLFRQVRIGQYGRQFTIFKLRTMRPGRGEQSSVTTSLDPRVTRSGAVMRRLKVDELPQLINVLLGQMSLVGPRPDVPGFADHLVGGDRVVLAMKPGITGPAALAYRHEEQLLAGVDDPVGYNRDVIWPDKVRINRSYVESYSLKMDLHCLWATVASVFSSAERNELESKQ